MGDISISNPATGDHMAYVPFSFMIVVASSSSDPGKNIIAIPTKNSSYKTDGSVHWNIIATNGGLDIHSLDSLWGNLSVSGASDLGYLRFLIK